MPTTSPGRLCCHAIVGLTAPPHHKNAEALSILRRMKRDDYDLWFLKRGYFALVRGYEAVGDREGLKALVHEFDPYFPHITERFQKGRPLYVSVPKK